MDAPIPVNLQEIRESILDGTYNTATKAKRCTIQEVHKVVTNQVSPQKMGKCTCLKGKCNPKRCGCATKKSAPVPVVAMGTARTLKTVNECGHVLMY
jgi:hypothetical protein